MRKSTSLPLSSVPVESATFSRFPARRQAQHLPRQDHLRLRRWHGDFLGVTYLRAIPFDELERPLRG